MLKFDGALRYASPGKMPSEVVQAIFDLIVSRVASQAENSKTVYELFKRRFCEAAGSQYTSSSSPSWARSDLDDAMQYAAENAALFVDSLHSALADLEQVQPSISLPPWHVINALLAPSGYAIDPPNLVIGTIILPVPVPESVASLDAQANDRIQRSLTESQNLLNGGRYRLAVQEILWLLETVSTAFADSEHDDGTVTGKYFNRIVGDLKRLHNGRVLGQVVGWMATLHGYLSSPSGGGVRHGAVLSDTYELDEGEARLFCDLTRSYISYLLYEHQRLGLK